MADIQTDTTQTDTTNATADQQPDELTLLKERADLMGIQYHPNIGLDTLRERVNAALTKDDSSVDTPADEAATETTAESIELTQYQKNKQKRDEATKLVRVVVNCHNPAKQLWQGELFAVSNRAIGSIKKFVPFNNEEGWHVPNAILQMMEERKCPVYYTYTDPRTKFKTRRQKLIKEFTITKLPMLTQEELDELARRQALSNSID